MLLVKMFWENEVWKESESGERDSAHEGQRLKMRTQAIIETSIQTDILVGCRDSSRL